MHNILLLIRLLIQYLNTEELFYSSNMILFWFNSLLHPTLTVLSSEKDIKENANIKFAKIRDQQKCCYHL